MAGLLSRERIIAKPGRLEDQQPRLDVYVGAIHGRLLTAWSTAGVLGPVLVNYSREYQIDGGVPTAQAYNVTMYVLAALLVIGLVCNLMVKPVHPRYHMTGEELAAARAAQSGQRADQAVA